MSGHDSIQSLEGQLRAESRGQNNTSEGELWPLQAWYVSVYDKPFAAYSDRDLGIALRQGVYPEFVVPVVIELLEVDPTSGFGYAGELLESLAYVGSRLWLDQPDLADRLRRILASLPSEFEARLDGLRRSIQIGGDPQHPVE